MDTLTAIGAVLTIVAAVIAISSWSTRRLQKSIDAQSARIDAQGIRIDTQGKDLREAIDTQGRELREAIDAQRRDLQRLEHEVVEVKIAVARIEGPHRRFVTG